MWAAYIQNMSEKKTLIEQLAQKRDGFILETSSESVRPVDQSFPPLIKSADVIDNTDVVETRLQVIRQIELVEHDSLLKHQKPTSRGIPLSASAVKWAATIAVVAMGIVCFVYLPSPSGSTPTVSGPIKPVRPEAPPVLGPHVEPIKSPAMTVPVPLPELVVPPAKQVEGTTITVTPASPEVLLQTQMPVPAKPKTLAIKPKITNHTVLAKTPPTPYQAPQPPVIDLQNTSSAPTMIKPLGGPVPIASKAPQAHSCSGSTGLAFEQCNQCAAKSWLARANCEAQTKTNYCASRGRETPDCAVDYYTRG